jgi:hypothetical protein
MLKTIPAELASTYQLIQAAFPQGVTEPEYFPLLEILHAEMSDRTLAQVIADCFGREYHIVLNDLIPGWFSNMSKHRCKLARYCDAQTNG